MFGKWQNTPGFAILVAFNNPTCGWVRQVFLHVETPFLSKHKGSSAGSVNPPRDPLEIEPGPAD